MRLYSVYECGHEDGECGKHSHVCNLRVITSLECKSSYVQVINTA